MNGAVRLLLSRVVAALSSSVIAGGAAVAADGAPADPMAPGLGQAVYAQYCTVCHDVGMAHPGTFGLARYYGAEKAALAQRGDLTVDFVKQMVRHGRALMPAFRATEIGEQALDALAAYLAAGPHLPPTTKTKT